MAETSKDAYRRLWLPYCLERLKDGTYVPLNRHYKFLGVPRSTRVEYEAAPYEARFKITPAKARKLEFRETKEPARIYLYRDGEGPRTAGGWDAYQARLKLLGECMTA